MKPTSRILKNFSFFAFSMIQLSGCVNNRSGGKQVSESQAGETRFKIVELPDENKVSG